MSEVHRHSARREAPVQSVTTAAPGRSHDLRSRQRRYLWMMGIRVVCLPLAVVTTGWIRLIFIIGAVVLPYVAVVIVNAASRPSHGTIDSVPPADRPELPPAMQDPERK